MKHLHHILIALLLLPISLWAEVTIDGNVYSVDTLAHYQVGPGTYYTQVRLCLRDGGGSRRDVYILQVDRRNPYVSIHTVLSNDSLEKGECPSAMAIRKSQPGKRYFAGTNGDWWSTDRPGVPEGTFVTENTITITPQNGRAALAMCAIDQHDSLYYGHDFYSDVYLQTATDTIRCSHVNDTRYDNELVLYNAYNGHLTHTDNSGTEVLCRILPGSAWGTNTTLQAQVLRTETDKGNMLIEDNCFVLSASGEMQPYLNALVEGQTITLRIATSINGIYADFKAALGGQDRTFMLVNGVVDNNWDERHPRTGLGFSVTGDTIIHCVIDGRGKSIGATTGELAQIMQFFGAYNAMNMEGGGSSTMYLAAQGVMNVPSDGHERAESQGIFAVSNAPDDETVTKIAAYEPVVSMPQYGMLRPRFLGYNRYDMLLDTDLQDVTLSCDPSVGYIDNEGRFVCLNSGDLQAQWGKAVTTLHIRKVDNAPVALRLDSVLVSDMTAYPIEVEGLVGDNAITLQPEALMWTVTEPAIAEVSGEGVLTGIANGYTTVIGQLGDFTDTLLVHVQTTDTKPWHWIPGMQDMTLKPSVAKWNAQLLDSAAAQVLSLDYTGGRQANIKFNADRPVYSDPDYIELRLTPQGDLIQSVTIGVRANNGNKTLNYSTADLHTGQTNRIIINLDSLFRADALASEQQWRDNDQVIYPVRLVFATLAFSTDAQKRHYDIPIDGWYLHFREVAPIQSAVDNTCTTPADTQKMCTPQGIVILHKGKVYDLLGRPLNNDK